jgi:GNAT superfamily N-acetyltransferase
MEMQPLTPARFDDLAALFDTTAVTRNCHCTWFLLREPSLSEVWKAGRSRECFEGFAGSAPAPTGVLAYADGGEPVGWCAIGAHSWYPRLAVARAWRGADSSAWAVTCFYIRRQARHSGLSGSLLSAAVTLAAAHGATAVFGAPRADGVKTSGGDGYVGFESTFRACGFTRAAPVDGKRVLMHRAVTRNDGERH